MRRFLGYLKERKKNYETILDKTLFSTCNTIHVSKYQTFRNRDEFSVTTLMERRHDAHDDVADVQTAVDFDPFGDDLSAEIPSQRQRELYGLVQGQLLRLTYGAQHHLAVALYKNRTVKKTGYHTTLAPVKP